MLKLLALLLPALTAHATICRWYENGHMTTARYDFQMSLLDSGDALAAGGLGAEGTSLQGAEIHSHITGGEAPSLGYVLAGHVSNSAIHLSVLLVTLAQSYGRQDIAAMPEHVLREGS